MPRTKNKSDQPSVSSFQPSVSIITVCKDVESTIGSTIESAIAQNYPNIEFLIIDGNSTDGTMNRIEQSKHAIHKVVSEPDDGIYNAMNKGIRMATGDLLLFLNAGDTLECPHTIESVVRNIAQKPHADIYHGGVRWLDPETDQTIPKPAIRATGVNLFRGSLNHQAMFIRSELFERVGMYDEGYRLAGDYEWMLRALRVNRCRFVEIDVCVAIFLLGGFSTNGQHTGVLNEECERARGMHYGKWDVMRYRPWIRARKILGI